MGTFILRRVLYSIPVLIATSFIIFTFVSLAGDPLGQLKLNPYLSEQTLQNKIEEKHLDKPIPVRYLYWVKEASTDKFGKSLSTDQPIWPDLKRVIPHTLELVVPALLLSRSLRSWDRPLRRNTPVLGVRLQRDDVQLHRVRRPRLLARAHAPDPRDAACRQVGRAHLLHLRPEQHRSWERLAVRPRSRPAPRAPRDHASLSSRSPRTVATCAPRCWKWSTPTTRVPPGRRD